MRTFEILNSQKRRKQSVGRLLYDETAGSATIRIAPDAKVGCVPAMFNHYVETQTYEIDADWTLRWVQERVPPSSRHNIQGIMGALELPEYDAYQLLFASHGRCPQDDFFLSEVPDASAPLNPATTPERIDYALIDLNESLGRQIAAARKAAGLTQAALATKTGIQQSLISRIENGKGNPTLETLHCLAKALDAKLHIVVQ